jgi:CTP synthase
MAKLIFVSGGVCSGLGKGVEASSLGALLESRRLNVRMVKCNPCVNVGSGSQSPYQHGEIYVTDDGAQTDLDLGNYARFTSGQLSRANFITTGQIYDTVIRKEREGAYNGRRVQVVPHITGEIKARIMAVAKEDPETDIVIVEIGGITEDIECAPFLEAGRQLIHELGRTNAISVQFTLIPEFGERDIAANFSQNPVKTMRQMGIQPDILICRAPLVLDEAIRHKIAFYSNIENDAVFTSVNADSTIYNIPLLFYEQKLDKLVLEKLGIEARNANIKPWQTVIKRAASQRVKLRIGIVGKNIDLHDAYFSVYEALYHAGLECGFEVEIVKIAATRLEEAGSPDQLLGKNANGGGVDGVLVPGGFGRRGSNGMVRATAWARTNKIPYLGICLGMHIMVIDWGRNVLGWEDADSTEFNRNTGHPVISLLTSQEGENKGGVFRLGKYVSQAEPGTKIFAAYGEKNISERYWHSYGFSNRFRDEMTGSGLVIGAIYPEKDLVDCVEWPDHPWGLGVQFHPEYKSKPMAAGPLFRDFIAAARDIKTGETRL